MCYVRGMSVYMIGVYSHINIVLAIALLPELRMSKSRRHKELTCDTSTLGRWMKTLPLEGLVSGI